MTPVERVLTGIAVRLAGNNATVECTAPAGWRALGARNAFDPALTWAMTPLRRDPGSPSARPEGLSRLAPRTCRLIAAFTAGPSELGTRLCPHQVSDRRRAPAAAPSSTRDVSPSFVLGECDDWGSTLVAIHVLGHESIHLAGVIDEAAADCLAMQVDAVVAEGLGAARSLARRLAREYWAQYYRAQDPSYRSRECRDGGALDLFRGDAGWPTPHRYPADIAPRLASFAEQSLRE